MGLTAVAGGSTFTPAPEGTHVARCCQVIDLGEQHSDFYNKTQWKVLVGWELPNEKDDEGKPFLVWRRYTLSIHEKSTLGKDLESWRGKKFTPEEAKGFSLKKVLGAPCMLNIVHNVKDGQTYANVQTVMAVPRGTTIPDQVHATVLFDVDHWDDAVFATFGENLKKLIQNSKQGKARMGSNGQAGKPANGQAASPGAPAGGGDEADDIPF